MKAVTVDSLSFEALPQISLTNKCVARTFDVLMSSCQRLLEFTHLGGSKEPSWRSLRAECGVTTS